MSGLQRQKAVERLLDSCSVSLKKLWDAHVIGGAIDESKPNASSVRSPLGRFIFRLERLRGKFAIRLFQQNFHTAFRLFELLLAVARKFHTLFKELHRLIEREFYAFEPLHHFLEARERLLKLSLTWCLCCLVAC